MLADGFWNFKPCDKWDVLTDRHYRLIYDALSDQQTAIEPVPNRPRNDWSFYNDQDALLVRVARAPVWLTICLIYCLFQTINHAVPE